MAHRTTLSEEIAINALGAAFLIRNGIEITVDFTSNVDLRTVRVLLLGRVMGFLLRQRGWLALHASAIAMENGAVLFLGESRAGKSTTAAAFYRQGHTVITDDVAAVRVVGGHGIVQTAWPHLRLEEEAREAVGLHDRTADFEVDKYKVPLDRVAGRDTYPVRCVYLLEKDDRTSLEAIPPVAAAPLLSRHSFVKHRKMERESLAAHLRDCAAIAAATPVYRLRRPQSFDALPELVRLIEHHIHSCIRNPH
jgi:hypothetical protein